jgi:hypothetical protein
MYEGVAPFGTTVQITDAPVMVAPSAILDVRELPDGVGVVPVVVNVADTLCAALIVTVQLPVPEHAPVQPEKV